MINNALKRATETVLYTHENWRTTGVPLIYYTRKTLTMVAETIEAIIDSVMS